MTTPQAPRRRKIVFLGSRGIPDIQGGVEAHVAALAVRLVPRGWDVEVLGRKPYLPPGGSRSWRGVTVTPVWAPRSRSLEAILHTALGLFVAARRRPDIVHIHAIGPALMAPLARLLGLRVVVTHHGFDYQRQKWGLVAKLVLRLGEWVGMACAHGRIGVSQDIANAIRHTGGLAAACIPNGIDVTAPRMGTSYLDGIGVVPRRYILLVARIVEEKRQLDLISAFARLGDPTLRLLIVGSAEHGGGYLRAVEAATAATPGAMMTGFQSGEALAQLFANAALFVLPSSHEGMPIALLEALGHGLPVLASDIPANLALGLDERAYFPLGDIAALTEAMRARLARAPEGDAVQVMRKGMAVCWDRVVERTDEVYGAVLSVEARTAGARSGSAEAETRTAVEARR